MANAVADAVNARGSPIDARLQDILAHVQEIALHGVCHGASVALTANGDGDPDLPSGGGNYRCGGE